MLYCYFFADLPSTIAKYFHDHPTSTCGINGTTIQLLYKSDFLMSIAFAFQLPNIGINTIIQSAELTFKMKRNAGELPYDIYISTLKTYSSSVVTNCLFTNEDDLQDNPVIWKGVESCDGKRSVLKGEIVHTTDLKDLVQYHVNKSDWLPGNHIAFVFYNFDQITPEDLLISYNTYVGSWRLKVYV